MAMLAGRVCRIPLASLVSNINSFSRPALQVAPVRSSNVQFVCRSQGYASGSGRTSTLRRTPKQMTFKEKIMAPAGDGAFTMGKALVAGASVVGLGALCFYGLGMSNEVGTIDRMVMWSDVTRQRVRDTYMYFGGGLVFTAVSAVAITRSPAMMNIVMKNSWMSIIGTMVAMIGSGMVARSIPYKEGIGAKQLAWAVHAGIIGAVIAPLTFLGGPLLVRAACYTGGIVGGLSTLAMCAPSDKFLNMGGPLAMGLGVVFMSSIGSMFLPPTTALGAGLYSISLYGGLVLFSAFLLYDTQKIMKRAETHPVYAIQPYDPVNASISIYLDTINIFIRMAMILAGGGNRRR